MRRRRWPAASIPFAVHNANKRSVVLDPFDEDDCGVFLDLAAQADIVVDDGFYGEAPTFGTSVEELAAQHPHLVVLSITDFGATGPRSLWRATDSVLYAMCGSLSRSGPTTGTPVLPPDGIASATAAVQAAWAALVAYYNRLRCGTGEYIDFSRFDAVVMSLDPAFGAHGQVAAGIRRTGQWRGRPKNQDAYPIYPCKDGYVRLCVMAPRQWRGLRRWLGEPRDFQDPKYDVIGARFAAWPQISELVEALFAGQTMKDLVTAGQAHGVPIAAVLTPSRIMGSEHFQAVGAITDAELVPGVRTSVPTGYFVVDGQHAGFRAPGPRRGAGRTGLARQSGGGVLALRPRRRLSVCGTSHPGSGHHRRRRRAEPAVRRPGRRGHQDRERRVPGRAAAGPRRRGHERVVRLDTSQPPGDGPGSAQRHGQGDLHSAGRGVRRRLRQLQAGNSCRAWLFLRQPARHQPAGRARREQRLRRRRARGAPAWATGPWSARRPVSPGYGRPTIRRTRKAARGTPSTTRPRSFPTTWSGGSPPSRRWRR